MCLSLIPKKLITVFKVYESYHGERFNSFYQLGFHILSMKSGDVITSDRAESIGSVAPTDDEKDSNSVHRGLHAFLSLGDAEAFCVSHPCDPWVLVEMQGWPSDFVAIGWHSDFPYAPNVVYSRLTVTRILKANKIQSAAISRWTWAIQKITLQKRTTC